MSKDFVLEVCDKLTLNPSKKDKIECSSANPSSDDTIDSSRDAETTSLFDNIVVVPEFEFRVGTRLFELYLALQSFNSLTTDVLNEKASATYAISNCMCDDVSNSSSTNSTSSGDMNSSHGSSSSSSTTTQHHPNHHCLANYHWWFLKGVAKWLDIALLKAIKRIFKAVALDGLKSPVDELVQHTSSAVDIKTVFGQVVHT